MNEVNEFDFKFEKNVGELRVRCLEGWIKFHCHNNEDGIHHGELVMYREDGSVARRDLFVNGKMKNIPMTDENRMYAALKYGVPLVYET